MTLPHRLQVGIHRVVVAAALRHGETIIVGARHFDNIMRKQILRTQQPFLPEHHSDWEQGFIDQQGVFMDRAEALRVARESGQPLDISRCGSASAGELYSEGLY